MKPIFPVNIIIYSVLVLVLLWSCKPEDGNIGPKGEQGEAGSAGLAGDKGRPGSLYYKGGFVQGTIKGTGKDGVTPFDEAFSFEFSSGINPAIFTEDSDGYNFAIVRNDSLGSSSTLLTFATSTDFATARFKSGILIFLKQVGAAQYKTITGQLSLSQQDEDAPATVTNVTYNAHTGLLTGDFTWHAEERAVLEGPNQYLSNSSTGRPFTVTGRFSITARKGSF